MTSITRWPPTYLYRGNRGAAFSGLTTKRLTGQYHESSLPGGEGLSYYNARWYDPQLGRFLSADTIVPGSGNPQALNRYSYVLNNALRFIDPSGHAPCLSSGNGVTFCDNSGVNRNKPPEIPQSVILPGTGIDPWVVVSSKFIKTNYHGFVLDSEHFGAGWVSAQRFAQNYQQGQVAFEKNIGPIFSIGSMRIGFAYGIRTTYNVGLIPTERLEAVGLSMVMHSEKQWETFQGNDYLPPNNWSSYGGEDLPSVYLGYTAYMRYGRGKGASQEDAMYKVIELLGGGRMTLKPHYSSKNYGPMPMSETGDTMAWPSALTVSASTSDERYYEHVSTQEIRFQPVFE